MYAYPQFPERGEHILDGIWDFGWLGDTVALEQIVPQNAEYCASMSVPGCFDAGPAYAGQRGVGLYRRKIHLRNAGGAQRLHIGGMGLRGRIFWDGREIGSTELAYSGVSFDFDAGNGLHHELVIAADNRIPTDRSILFRPQYDFYGYGGIYRNVTLQSLPACRIERVQVRTLDLNEKKVRLKILIGGQIPAEIAFQVAFDDSPASDFTKIVRDSTIEMDVCVPDGRIWSPEHPNLHTVKVFISGDSIVERFGLRTVEAKDRMILINGSPVTLRGFNRHEAHPEFGPAIPVALMIEDLQFLKDIGCNFIRGAHYPQNQQFLDLCDQMGFLVWEESLGWGDDENRVSDTHFGDLQEQQTRRMVRNSINHPCIMIWAFLNEGCSNKSSAGALYRRLIGAIRNEDSSRLVSYASMFGTSDLFLAEVDVISMNTYPAWIFPVGWDDVRPLEYISQAISTLAEFCDRPELSKKPFIMSEIGAASIPGWRDRLKAAWSEDYQADYFQEAIRCVAEHPRLCGIVLWQFYDMRTFANGDVRSKARAFNGAGVLDEYRRPKLAYDAVKKAFHAWAEGKKFARNHHISGVLPPSFTPWNNTIAQWGLS